MEIQTASAEKTESEPTYEKVSDTRIKVSKIITTTTVEPVVEVLDRDFLESQIGAINQQRDMFASSLQAQLDANEASRTAEIADVQARLKICDEQGIKTQAEVEAAQAPEQPATPAVEAPEAIQEAIVPGDDSTLTPDPVEASKTPTNE